MIPSPVTCSWKYGSRKTTPTSDTNTARYLLSYRSLKKSDCVWSPYFLPSSHNGGRMKNETTYPSVT